MHPALQGSDVDLLDFARLYLGPLLELLLGWVLLVHGILRLLGRVQAEQAGRYPLGGVALVAGGLLLWHASRRF